MCSCFMGRRCYCVFTGVGNITVYFRRAHRTRHPALSPWWKARHLRRLRVPRRSATRSCVIRWFSGGTLRIQNPFPSYASTEGRQINETPDPLRLHRQR